MVEVYLPYTIAHELVNIPIHLHTFTYMQRYQLVALIFSFANKKRYKRKGFKSLLCVFQWFRTRVWLSVGPKQKRQTNKQLVGY